MIMQHKMKILTALAAASFSFNGLAATETLTGTFSTIKAVSISEISPLALTGMQVGTGAICTLEASTDGTGTDYVGDQTMNLANLGTSNAAGEDIALMGGGAGAGTCLATATGGAIGIYEIDGAPGATVKITIVDGDDPAGTGTMALAPTGCAGNYNGSLNGDICKALTTPGVAVEVILAKAGDTGGLGEGTPVAGKTRIALGATATLTGTLLAGTAYPVGFQINIAY
jgi:hypothetical protein